MALGKRIARRIAGRGALLHELSMADPQAVYAALLSYARTKNYKAGWCAHAFKEIFGTWPQPQDLRGEAEPLPDFLIEEWAALRPRQHIQAQPVEIYERTVPEEGRHSWLECKSSKPIDDEQIKSAISRIPLSWRRDEVLKSLHSAGPQAVYAALMHYARSKYNGEGAADWAHCEFAEIFGVEPNLGDTVESVSDILIDDIEEWVSIREEWRFQS